ncbi:cell surface A33 antigen [Heterocephalus glaber]|uniref:Cell surface A33 antigen n=1 Tax=Heterocephalus glaber TaxID=10181 RepID=A0AAX6QLT4_HETGA|nr:cell surface A33 antigen [Heterocephalus glaber]
MLPVLWMLCAVWVTTDAISVETPQDTLRAAQGKSVTLPCTYSTSAPDRDGFIQWDKLLRSHTEKVVTWTFRTQAYLYGSLYENRVKMASNAEQSDASLTIEQLSMDDNGTYECSVSLMSDLGGNSKSRVCLLVLVPPSPPDCSIEGETVIGNNIQLTCLSAEGSPEPQYSWKSYDSERQERALRSPASGQSLLLKNISTEMSGYYTCFSSNEMGTSTCDITLTVRPPSMNVALYAGIAAGVVAALIIVGVAVYFCCFREKDAAAEDKKGAKPDRAVYHKPQEQMQEFSREREEDHEDNDEDQRRPGHQSPSHSDQ